MGKKNNYTSDFEASEIRRDEKIHTRFIEATMNRLRKVLRYEVKKGTIKDKHRDRFIMTAEEFLSKSYVRISIKKLYCRYRQIRLMALSECLAIVKTGDTQQQNADAILEKINEAGQAHKASTEREKKKKLCAASSE